MGRLLFGHRQRAAAQPRPDAGRRPRSAAIKFLVTAPFILAFLLVVNLMTSPGDWWIQWPALGLGIAWVINLLRVVRDVLLAGGLAALGWYLWNRYGNPSPHGQTVSGQAATPAADFAGLAQRIRL